MKSVSVSGSPRGNVGKKDAKRLRRDGLIPCVLYGGEKQFHFTAPETDFKDIVYTPEACLVKIEIEGKAYNAILQDIQFHPVDDHILHADFLEIFPDKMVKISVPIKLSGNSPGVIKGGKLHVKLRKLRIQAMPADLPDHILVNISNLDIGDSVKVGQLLTDKVSFLDPGHAVVAMVKSTRTVVTAGAAEDDEESTEASATDAPAEAAK